MANTIVGKYGVFGATGLSGTSGIVTASKIYILEANLEVTRNTQELRDANGDVVGKLFGAKVKTMRLRMTPFDASSETGAASNWQMPAIGTKCTLAANTTLEPSGIGDFAGTNWILISYSKRISYDGYAEFDANLEAHENIT